MRPEIHETLQQAILHLYHTNRQGGQQEVGRTYNRTRDHFHWRGCTNVYSDMWENVLIVKQANDDLGSRAIYPFQIIAMDHIPSPPGSFNGNTELLIFVDRFSRYVIVKTSTSRFAQTIAEISEECLFR
ncbi:reverse transcriptase [Phytophthora megakarya]|uniref:Reverse transcriptase n=1 Tax=Phytophthora megakarya TaxID=4795 RepID=A0A225WMU9_9STRA|nr:reverse transcriptase [Phytophthora megakarya]